MSDGKQSADAGRAAKRKRSWRAILLVALLGGTCGLGLAVARVSRATSYLSDSPDTCVNCHVMTPQYISHKHSSHREVATCNDCHVPHGNIVANDGFKAMDGLKHSAVFTMRAEPQVIRLSKIAIPVVENNCRRCHDQQLHAVSLNVHADGDLRCWDCHRHVPHGVVRSLSARPDALGPRLPLFGDGPDQIQIGGRRPDAANQSEP